VASKSIHLAVANRWQLLRGPSASAPWADVSYDPNLADALAAGGRAVCTFVVSARKSALVLALVVIGWWGVEMIQCYPDYHFNGYQWLGKRVLFGRSSIGYRSIVFTPADGVQQVMKWLNENAKHDEVAQLCGFPWHIVRYAAPGPVYQLTNGLETTLAMEPNYVVLHVNDLLWQGQGTDRPVGEIVR
jgi:hypothetical protein